ncbi:ferredoxin [Methanogenium cariaci]|uniref:(2Fe-2S) ferredoxin domain-containing protein n=1 Tax=Methanogenium cariaci TaxID=2197 RepID=UPI000A6FBE8A|nr:(2Fe-2S) ferredoxin domain-containing protein [Methanogenium cariaci]
MKNIVILSPPKRRGAPIRIRVCAGTGCLASGSQAVYDAFVAEAEHHGMTINVDFAADTTGCHGFCENGPIVQIDPANIFYQHVKPDDVPEIFEKTIVRGGEAVQRLLYRDAATKTRCRSEEEIPFYAHQQRIVLQRTGHIDPTDINDYIREGGYAGLVKALSMKPKEIVDEVIASGLRGGRGGGGFPVGIKWESARIVESEQKYVVANGGDEGDPRCLHEPESHGR